MTPQSHEGPIVSAVICTRDRGDSVLRPVRAILSGTHADFELLIVDQSVTDTTERAIESALNDGRVRYIRTSTVGLSRARNIGIRSSRAPLIAFTDDDCEPDADWLGVLVREWGQSHRPGIFFGPFLPDPGASKSGFVGRWRPAIRSNRTRPRREFCLGGWGGNMALTRSATELAGLFDEALGRGGKFPSAEEADMALRVALAGGTVQELVAPNVTHFGVVPFEELRNALRLDYQFTGVALGRLARGRGMAPLVQLAILIERECRGPAKRVLYGGRPVGLGRVWWLVQGFVRGLALGHTSARRDLRTNAPGDTPTG